MGLKISLMTAISALTTGDQTELSQLSTVVLLSSSTLSAQASDNSFNHAGSGFITAGFAVNDQVNIVGFTGNVANNIYSAKITALTAGKMTIGGTDGDVIVDDAAGETVVISKWITRRASLLDIRALFKTYFDTIYSAGSVDLKGLTFTSDTSNTADTDPGNGVFKWNNATQPSATTIYFDNQSADGASLTTFYSGAGTSGYIYVQQSDDSTRWQLWKWSALTAGSGYYKFTVAYQAGSTNPIQNTKTCFFDFSGAGSGGAGQTTIQFKDEGSSLGSSGTVDTVDFVGSNVTASRAGNVVTVTVSGAGSSGITRGTAIQMFNLPTFY